MRSLFILLVVLSCTDSKENEDESTDRDGDGLTNAQEHGFGTDPDNPDTDGDGYRDGDEIATGHDPIDSDDVIYEGGWPFNAHKSDLGEPDWDTPATEGAQVPRFVGKDQFGQDVELYDFAMQGKSVALDLSTEWCGPCRAVARWLDGEEQALVEYPWWNEDYSIVPELVNSGEIYWVTILYEDANHDDATPDLGVRWYEEYPHPLIPVLVDEDKQLHSFVRPTGIPNVNLLTEHMEIDGYSDRGLTTAFDRLVTMYVDG